MDHRHPYATLACPPSHRGDGSRLSRPVQIVSGTDRCAFPNGGALCGTQCAAGEVGHPSGRLAVVEWVATDSRGSEAEGMAQCVAGRAAARLGVSRESSADRIGVGGAPGECAARSSIWCGRVGTPNGETIRNGVHVTAPRAPERIVKKDSRPLLLPSINNATNATVGVTTLEEVQKTYGMVEPSRVSREEEADVTICYVHSSPKGKSFLVFESGIMGGYIDITGFRISTIRPSSACVVTKIDVGALTTGNGVRLGQSLEDFKKTVPVEFMHHGSELAYEAVGQRAATQEELKGLHARWPNEKQDHFDVTTNIKAEFRDNRLIDFYIHKIESY